MGTFFTKKQAAELLGVSERMIYRYLDRGYLRPATEGRQIGVYREDVLELREVRDREKLRDQQEPLPFQLNGKTIGLLHARVSTLESQMATVMRLLGLRSDPLRLTDPEALALYRQAAHHAEEGWSPHVEHQLADIFTRLRHDDLEQLERIANDPHPWRPFARLCATMYLAPHDGELRGQLGAGRAHLRQLALVWVHVQGTTVKQAEMLVEQEDRPNTRLVRRRGRELNS
jgi:excisionase family DNA binding protein